MKQLAINFARQLSSFVSYQYMVIILGVSTLLKMSLTYNKILGLNWYDKYINYGLWTDLLIISVLFSIIFMAGKYRNKLAFGLSLLISTLLLVDSVYNSYFSALPTMGLISSIGQTTDIGPAIGGLLQWWYIFFFIDIVLIFAFRRHIRNFIQSVNVKYSLKTPSWRISASVFLIIFIVFWVHLIKPGDGSLGEVLERGYDTKSTANKFGVLMAHGVDITRFVIESTTRLSKQQEQNLKQWVKANQPPQTVGELNGSSQGKNIIMIQVESLGGFVIGQKINGKEITPSLNQLAKETHFFPNDRFVIGAGHTSDTDFVANTSYFPLDDSAVFVRYGRSNFSSLPKTLSDKGYSSYAFHGFNRNFWNRNQALKSLGYQKFYAADNYPDSEKINMGISDGVFLDKTAQYINTQPKPSFSYVVTLSSHVPFSITDQTKELGVNPDEYPDQVGGYLENINYVDRMLGKFFEKLKEYKLYDDSLIVMYGDHTPVLPAFSAGTIKYDPSTVQVKEVPLFIKLPKQTTGKTFENKGTHIDIMPTVLDLVGVKTNQLMFGQSLFASGDDALKVCTDQFVVFNNTGDCKSTLETEKIKSGLIVRYNQFNNIND